MAKQKTTETPSTRDFFIQRVQLEHAAFVRVLQALPIDRLDYRPHERSPSAAEIMHTLSREMKACCDVLENGRIHWNPSPPKSPKDLLSDYERHHEDLTRRLMALDDKVWNRRGQFLVGAHVAMEQSVGDFLWMFLFDAVHHRGQLSAYIRPMGGRVPAIYGPSGDDPNG